VTLTLKINYYNIFK